MEDLLDDEVTEETKSKSIGVLFGSFFILSSAFIISG